MFFIWHSNRLIINNFQNQERKNKMKVVIKKSSINCPRGEEIFTLASSGNVPYGIIFAVEISGIGAYVDNETPENRIGSIISIDGDNDISELATIVNTNYQFRITGVEGTNKILGEIEGVQITKGEPSKDAELDKLFEEHIKSGLITPEDKELILSIMDDHKIDPLLRRRIVAGYKTHKRPVKKPSSVYVNPDPSETSPLAKALRQAVGRKAMIYKGDKSVGKNVCAETVAYIMQMPYYIIGFNKQMMPEDVYGSRTIKNTVNLTEEDALAYLRYQSGDNSAINGAANFEINKAKASAIEIALESSEFCEALEFGGLLMFNEINMADANFLQSFTNPIADGTGYIFIPGKGKVDIHPDFILVGSENENYSGAADQNEATMSRMGGIEFPYPPSVFGQLKSVTEGVRGKDILKDKYYTQCDNLYKLWRDAVHKGQLSNTCLNIRGFVRALDEVATSGGYDSLKEEIDTQIITMCDVTERVALRARAAEAITL